MTRPNVALVGKMYSGKTTMANAFVANQGYRKVAMAGPLKLIAKLAYGEDIQKDKNYPVVDLSFGTRTTKSGRKILQQIGQSLKAVDRDIWLKIFINDTNDMNNGPYVVDDVRFKFEADYLRSAGWVIVKIDTEEAERVRRAFMLTGKEPTHQELNHESEVEVDDISEDVYIDGRQPIELVPAKAELIASMGGK